MTLPDPQISAWTPDEVMRDVRAAREAISDRFGNDTGAILAHVREQARLRGAPTRTPQRVPATPTADGAQKR